ncbi:MAG: transcription termination/antitermination protein NusG [Thermoguttaceae bacterium]
MSEQPLEGTDVLHGLPGASPAPGPAEPIAAAPDFVADGAGESAAPPPPVAEAEAKPPAVAEPVAEVEAKPPAVVEPVAEVEAKPPAVVEPVAEVEAKPPAVVEPVPEVEAKPPAVVEPVAEVEAKPPAVVEPVPEAEAKPPAVVESVPEVEAKPPAVVEPVAEAKSDQMDWYILKVQSNREESIREGLLRRVAIAGLGRFFGEAIVPTEKVTEFKGGKKRVIKRKLYPGYLVVQMEINEDTWFLVRETPGIGDFTGGSGHPTPMLPHEVARIVSKQEEKSEKAPKLKIGFAAGERVKINEGTFENFEGEVESIDETNGRVTVMINIFGRSTPVELEYWQIEAV